ncbi:MAG TPA: hypothetical protein VMW41_01280 [Candidatus Bathyarchaeia archaeon]|nr:hypothetical protein [Candidatus Bathyarchaeia archaeon]
MLLRYAYVLMILILLPISLLLIFKPSVWQNLYHRIYQSEIESKGASLLNIIANSLLSMASTEAGETIHRAIGIILAIIILYIFYVKINIVSPF